ncbi:MAG: C40 family peptidase [Bacilli bacterium]|nr:C40 family peptidase [Bacilli bacterium]
MNIGNIASSATTAAGSSATNGLANVAGGATNNALNGATNVANSVPNNVGTNNVSPLSPSSSLPDLDNNMPSENGKISLGGDGGELPQNRGGNEDNSNNQEDQASEGVAPGTKVAPGKEVGKDGQIKDSSTKKLTTAVGQGAAAYFTGGQSLGKDQMIKNNGLADKAIGVVSDVAEKTPGVKQVADALDEAGVIDAATDAMDMVGSIKNGDIGGAIEKGKDLAKDKSKMQKHVIKKMMPIIIISAGSGLLFIVLIIGIISPVAGGIMDLTEKVGEFFDAVGDFVGNLFGGSDAYDILTDLVEDYDSLSEEQKKIVIIAASALERNYNWGGHPNGPGYDGFPTTGLDCAGFVQWVLWTAYGMNPGYLTTSSISDLIGSKFQEIDESELQPGDIGLKFRGSKVNVTNHTGIYAGNGNWIHAAGAKQGVINSKYKNFTIFLRYVG